MPSFGNPLEGVLPFKFRTRDFNLVKCVCVWWELELVLVIM